MSSKPLNNRSDVLREAEALVNGDRNDTYGDPIDDFRTTAELWTTYIRRIVDRRESTKLQPHDVASMMLLLKVSRLTWSPEKRDHWVDAIGYASCGWDCVEREGIADEWEGFIS
jgi:hypothetical protein